MLNKILTIVISFLISLICTGQAYADVNANLKIDESQSVAFELPDGWVKNTKKIPYDMQYLSGDRRLNTAIFLYQKIDLAKKMDKDNLLKFHHDDLKGKRKNYELIEKAKALPFENGNITIKWFAGDKITSRYYYGVSVIELDDAPEIFLVSVQVAIPSVWKQNKSSLEAILQSTKLIK